MDENALDELKYDVLVMDEGQDIIKPNYLYSLDYLLRDGFQNGHWTVFYDERQNIYNPEYPEGLDSSYSKFMYIAASKNYRS